MEPTIDHGMATWDELTARLDRFVAAWSEANEPPDMGAFLPAAPTILRRLTLIELIKVDLEFRWKRKGCNHRLEDYGGWFDELANSAEGIPADLVYEEYHVRRSIGDTVTAGEFLARFPLVREPLKRLLNIEGNISSTTLVARMKPSNVEVGEQLDDFDLLLQLGEGAFAKVFLARQRSMQRLVALKVSADRGSEPQTLAQLDHPNIVRVYDQRQLPERRLRLLYMQYVSGGTLQNVVARAQTLPLAERSGRVLLASVDEATAQGGHSSPGESTFRRRLAAAEWPETVCRLGAQLALALDYAHRRGVLHRDLKPANVLLASDGSPKLADFNISFAATVAGATPTAYFGGSLAYMSPEQLEASNPDHVRQPEELDGRSDIYSLGVVLWELLFGERPFQDEHLAAGWNLTLAEMTHRRNLGPPRAPRYATAAPYLNSLVRCIRQCLDPAREKRYAQAADLARDLLLCLQPHTERILSGAHQGWKQWIKTHPIWAVVLATILPNALAGWFNHNHNHREALADLGPRAVAAFTWAKYAINGAFFPLGGILALIACWPIATIFWRMATGKPRSAELLIAARRRALTLGEWAAVSGISLWTIAGFLYPIWLQLAVGEMPVRTWLHFILSHIICGLIAAAFPFLLISSLSLRTFYPSLLMQGGEINDEFLLLRLGRKAGFYLLLAGFVPMFGLMTLILGRVGYRPSLVALSVAGAAGLAFAFYLHGVIQRDVTALLVAVRARDDIDSLSDSTDFSRGK